MDEWGMIAPEASDEAWVAISAPPAPPVSCEALSLHSLRFDPDEPNRILATISNAGPVPARLDRVTFHWPNHPGYPQMKLDWFKLNKRTIWDGDSRRHPTEVALKGPERRRMVAPREEAVWKVKISQGPERIDQVFPIEWFGVDMAVSLGDMQCELQLPPTPPPPASCDGLTVSSLQFEEDHPDRLQATIYNGTGLPALLNRIVFQWPKSQDYPKMRLDWFKLKDKKIWNGDSKDHPADVILSSAPSKRVLFPGEQAEWEVRIKKGPKPLAEVFSPDQFAVTMYMDVAGTQCAVASKPAAPPPPAPTPTPSPTPVLEGPPVDGNPNDMSGADQICLYQADAPTNPLARIQYMQVVASDGTPQLHVALILDKSFVDNTYGANSLGYYDKRGRPKQHRFRDLVGSDHAQIYFEDANGQRVLEIKIDYISPSDAFPSGYGSLGVRGGDGSVILGDPNWILATGTSLSYNFNELGYVLTQDSPATDANYTPNPDYPDWIYDVVYEMRIDMAAFGQAGLGNIGIDHVHASPSKVGVNSLPVVPGPCVP
ncbi:MAG TPA: hypothetical protein G4O02_18045 [Caldilineae bacterium]|nr:hypothetical protein [Caldilineae bacterium]